MTSSYAFNRRTIVAAGLAAPALLGGRATAESLPVVETTSGRVRGRVERGAQAFKGVPYGGPTDGAARFRPPGPVAPWTGIREAADYGPYSPQLRLGPPNPRLASYYTQLVNHEPAGPSEDCLYLNVWTPRAGDGGKRPVMVWCHGGGFLIRSGGSAVYDGASLSQGGDVVVVTLNHRLNVFGFLDLQDIGGAAYAPSGNVGMLDIVQALQWVHDNIAAFGGDPDCVTIFGQSGGAGKISTLLAMPSAKGLFHRAIMESGASPRMSDRADATAVAQLVLEEAAVKATGLGGLQALSTDQLLGAARRAMVRWTAGKSLVGNFGFLPVVDGVVLPAQPFDPVAPAVSADVPVMLGYTSTEMTLFEPPGAPTDAASLVASVGKFLGRDPSAVIAAFRADHPNATPAELSMLIETHGFTGVNTIKVAEARAAQHRAPSYMYLFAWETQVLGLRAPHTIEIPFVFKNLDIAQNMVGPLTPAVQHLGDQVSGAWVAFARSGNPDHAGLPDWPAYDPRTRDVMVFDTVSAVRADPWPMERRALMDM